jgi:hypothetical protein
LLLAQASFLQGFDWLFSKIHWLFFENQAAFNDERHSPFIHQSIQSPSQASKHASLTRVIQKRLTALEARLSGSTRELVRATPLGARPYGLM